jgi:Ca2+-binding EF-hand superfamily protein
MDLTEQFVEEYDKHRSGRTTHAHLKEFVEKVCHDISASNLEEIMEDAVDQDDGVIYYSQTLRLIVSCSYSV